MIKLFAHRGLVAKNIAQNSIDSLKNAYLKGFRAIEFDIWFLDDELVLKHNRPDFIELKTLPKLQDYFLYKNEMEYWMDFKNLDDGNAKNAMELVKKNADSSAIDLENIYFAPFITDYRIAAKVFRRIRTVFGEEAKIVAVCERLENEEDVMFLSNFLKDNQIKFLSIFHQLVDEKFMEIFSQTEILVWTVNDSERVEKLQNIGVRNFATDNIIPI